MGKTEVVNQNFLARYINGNIQKQKSILNMHLNIQSLKNKIYEVNNLIKEHNPHIFGLSECELNKDKVDETTFYSQHLGLSMGMHEWLSM